MRPFDAKVEYPQQVNKFEVDLHKIYVQTYLYLHFYLHSR